MLSDGSLTVDPLNMVNILDTAGGVDVTCVEKQTDYGEGYN